jgi:hypothetical protein
MPRGPRSGAALAVLLGGAIALGVAAGPGERDATGQTAPPPAPAPTLARVDEAHPPVAWGGPDGRGALDGEWTERGDPSARGEALGWPSGRFSGAAVHMPYSPNAGRVRGAAGLRSHLGSVAWYRTTFSVPRAGDHALRFESVNHRATVWVDGRLAGRHTGAYLPFDVELSLTAGPHVLVVRADWRGPTRMKATGWHRTWFNFGGIDREVTLRALGRSALDAPGVVTRLGAGAADVDVAVVVRNRAGPRTVRVQGTLGRRALAFPAVPLAGGASREVHARLRIAAPDLWAPGHPALSELRLAVPGESGWSERVGLRELRWARGRLLLDRRPLRLRGASVQEDAEGRGDALLPADMDAVVQRLQAIRANATRAQHALSPALLERLDAAGILVLQEVGPIDAPGNWTSNTPALRADAGRRAVGSVRQLRVHPSVLAWSLGNEVANNGHTGGQAAWIAGTARRLHGMDPGRPTALDVWGSALPDDAGGLMYRDIDLVGVTLYEGWYQRPGEASGVLARNLRRRLGQIRRIFAGRVLVASEFGAEGNGLNPASAPGGLAYQARVIGAHLATYRADPALDGWLVWALQDFALVPTFRGGSIARALPGLRLVRGVNQKGLYTYGGRPKPAVAVVARG